MGLHLVSTASLPTAMPESRKASRISDSMAGPARVGNRGKEGGRKRGRTLHASRTGGCCGRRSCVCVCVCVWRQLPGVTVILSPQGTKVVHPCSQGGFGANVALPVNGVNCAARDGSRWSQPPQHALLGGCPCPCGGPAAAGYGAAARGPQPAPPHSPAPSQVRVCVCV